MRFTGRACQSEISRLQIPDSIMRPFWEETMVSQKSCLRASHGWILSQESPCCLAQIKQHPHPSITLLTPFLHCTEDWSSVRTSDRLVNANESCWAFCWRRLKGNEEFCWAHWQWSSHRDLRVGSACLSPIDLFTRIHWKQITFLMNIRDWYDSIWISRKSYLEVLFWFNIITPLIIELESDIKKPMIAFIVQSIFIGIRRPARASHSRR